MMNPPSAETSPALAACGPHLFPSLQINTSPSTKKKRRPAGTPDPDAEVVSLSPRTLLESDRYVCEICNQGFQRDQNLQMHRRRHKVPWKLVKREGPGEVRKRVFVCPEPSCLHHDPCHALGDLVGIKKHFRRKHSGHRQWVCARCSKGYAVQSDYKAHLKTCGTRGHSCDCGRVFSRVESFIEHQDTCNAGRSRTSAAASPSPSSDIIPSPTGWPLRMPTSIPSQPSEQNQSTSQNLELQLLPPSDVDRANHTASIYNELNQETCLQLSIGFGSKPEPEMTHQKLKEVSREQLMLAMADKARADEVRQHAKRQVELAEQELANAKRIRMQAQTELSKAHAIRDHAMRQINATLLQITCFSCKQKFRTKPTAMINSGVASYVSSVVTREDNDEQNNQGKALCRN
ncbi:hypothetical protein LUZ63_001292 [Rhynchospora breviuscula]|uniref:C2H2-type domain-containing protein n=1 Tax=Rhynchospora breviuscula TaxID=2022672 RepID=A0A9Q0CWJ8_9POAL|nr:hypothetical protein LUZ63_001292 [Rhynchospora breviuscula]